jgi:formylglycine-generating enzyme required for sulfatase activity
MSAVLSTAEEDRLWSQLIRFIRDGALVPITGPELLDVPGPDGQSKNFYTLVAEDVARVVRGGSWNNNPDNARSAARNNNTPDNRNNNIGFSSGIAPLRGISLH